jgi:tetratricopeptide (TPR) repeat protein
LGNALKYLTDALKIHREFGYRQGEASDLGNIGLVYSAKGDLGNALKYLTDALKIHREFGYRQGEANQLGNIGLVYSAKGDLGNALKYLTEALNVLDRCGLVYGRDTVQRAINSITHKPN